ncbi:hypothetical protein MPAR168_23360 [Methylorubrum populi]|uniref:Curlin associated repeat protein n=2 Tax=Hyphomicrobiales TaxID=356 RepID=A0ABU7TH08_9HYPH
MAQSNGVFTNQQGTDGRILVNQSGSSNKAGLSSNEVLYQTGAGNNLIVNQSGNDNVVGKTTAGATGGVNPDGQQNGNNNTLRIDQSGNGNAVKYRQLGNNNGNLGAGQSSGANGIVPPSFQPLDYGAPAGNPTGQWNFVSQAGNGSSVSIDQNSSGNNGIGNGILIFQGGTDVKEASVTQSTAGASNYAYLDQRADGASIATVNQTNTGQDLQFNLADIRQGGTATTNATQNGYLLDLFVNQAGGTNVINSTQSASSNSVMAIFQDGNNEVTARQTNASEARLFATQTGNNNNLTSDQTGVGSIATVIQTGDGNIGFNNQVGLQTASITQSSNSNTFYNDQFGAGLNTFTLLQTGGGSHSAISNQNGSLLVANVEQYGSNNQYIGTQAGLNNVISVQQASTLNVANLVQGGSGNTATIRQNR